MSEIDKSQVDGTHYKDVPDGVQQHWNRMWGLYGEAWFVGNVTKYVERYRKKNGLKDLAKAKHYLDKLIELETERYERERVSKSISPDDGESRVNPIKTLRPRSKSHATRKRVPRASR